MGPLYCEPGTWHGASRWVYCTIQALVIVPGFQIPSDEMVGLYNILEKQVTSLLFLNTDSHLTLISTIQMVSPGYLPFVALFGLAVEACDGPTHQLQKRAGPDTGKTKPGILLKFFQLWILINS